jgi:ribonuclease G
LRREILALRHRVAGGEVLIRVHPEIAKALQGEEHEVLSELEEILGTKIIVQADPDLHWERFDVLEV